MEKDKKKTAKQAAVEVLSKAGEPLKTVEIVKRVLGTPGVELKGKTPGATIAALLAVENTKPDGLFVRTAPGTYGLRQPQDPAQPKLHSRRKGTA